MYMIVYVYRCTCLSGVLCFGQCGSVGGSEMQM